MDTHRDVIKVAQDGELTVGELLDLYSTMRSPDWSLATRSTFRSHVLPLLEAHRNTPVRDLSRTDIARTNAAWLAAGCSPGTVRRRHTILSAALGYAETELELIDSSPARGVRLPTVERMPIHLPLMSDAFAAISRFDHRHLRMIARLAAATGARRGELLALRWSDLDLDGDPPALLIAATISSDSARLERKPTKTGRSGQRRVAIDPGTVNALRRWQAELTGQTRAAGPEGRLSDQPIVPSPVDPTALWVPDQVTARWASARRGTILAPVRFHDLRHLHATTLLAAGVPIPVVAARLGHASTQMTLDRYGHAIPAQDQMASDVIASAQTAWGHEG